MSRLDGKMCLITGAARGIGEAIAHAFVAEGADIIVTDKDAAGAKAVADQLGGQWLKLDVAEEADWLACAEAFPLVDVVVNNAGVTGFEDGAQAHDPEHVTLADWHDVHRVNLDGTFLGCRYAIRAMRKKAEGSIINISSRSGMVGIPGAAAYASSKAAIRNHSKSVALYCAEQALNIRCNSIHPAAVLTPMWEPMLGDGPEREKRMAEFVADTPMRRFGKPEEVAALAVLLASDEAAYMTGTELTVDGGLLAGSSASPSRE
ncbi:SDR family oxidoreductase [Parasphingopyxis sp. CP4]|uniref:SDR family NAD(P)-dependent oxidoreductase n=1 Tax=Parasphingopyxis sp. CP4 TaxID=2724527 RepID=UPI0015A16735|nr:SDR family oxidoreductase [Parasphingopyxis sp. CP4]QLC20895.1 SDR family oxidoreductase [Parasphingopyxis sp. CP4]